MIRAIVCLLAVLQVAFAQYYVILDQDTYSTGDTIQISWQESSSNSLKLENLDTCEFLLCNCANDPFCDNKIVSGIKLDENSTSVTVSNISSLGPDGYYAIQMVALRSTKKSEYVIQYSEFFEITSGMTGSGTALKDCDIPGDEEENVPGTASSVSVWTTSYTLPANLSTASGVDIPYTWQKGPTRTCPTVPTPASTVKKTTTPSRRYPTSSLTPYKSYFINPRMPVVTGTPSVPAPSQYPHKGPDLSTTPTGYAPTRVVPVLSIATGYSTTTAAFAKRRARRWA